MKTIKATTHPKHKKIWHLWFVVFLLVTTPIIPAYYLEMPGIAIFPIILAAFLGLVLIIEPIEQRIIKGFALILYGTLFNTFYLGLVFFKFFPENTMSDVWQFYLDTFSQVILFACAGAGGSIIALHSDKFSTDKETPTKTNSCTNTKQEIVALTNSVNDLNKKLKILIGILIALALVLLLVFLIR